jgi:translocation and assembly module TamA
VARLVSSRLRISGGVGTRISKVEQVDATENYALLLSPWTLDFNFSDDLLNPSQGGRAILELAPYTDIRSSHLTFTRTFGEYRHFLSSPRLPGVVLAGRLALGVLSGASRSDIPADEHFYAGGGGSIRGYEYQTVGDIVDGQPIGGNSLIETSLELRTRFAERWGLVAFLDGGMAFESSTPTQDLTMQWGAGLGVRMFTGMGPIRVDLAVPVNPRENLDENYQFYVSLGQAF